MRFRSDLGSGPQRVRAGGRRSRREMGGMRIVAGHTIQPSDRAEFPVPESAGPAMSAGFPVAVSRAMATATKGRAFGELQLAAIARLKRFKIGFVVAVETKIVAIVASMVHHDVRVFFRDEQNMLLIEAQRRRFV